MKKIIVSILIFLISLNVYASSGAIKQSSVILCDGIYYGSHANHWHIVKEENGKYVINEYPLKKTKVVADSKVLLVTNSTNIVLPDFTGWTYNEVNTYASLVGIKVNITGYGYVVGQSIPPNSPVTKDLIVDLTLSK